ncbi:consensus ankyrin repeat-containing protein [Stylonychia lemnae]|uniref:Consensus ankyrin repeat-containing protein n=1 Tax=Stylonychia lemnae TaxID=5949 RepID=A0A078AP47_STYLE|nr:consensus ankyrin repeat-containing protein [Stylonychia lemnae]|eukprot:CDW84155.1 consensus ankyrin repeat-containing protein [Stylonychia lemnae]
MLHCEEGNIQEVRKIVEDGRNNFVQDIDIEYKNESGLTPLALALKYRRKPIAEYLINKGANVNSLNKVITKLFADIYQFQAKQSILFNTCYDNYAEGLRLLINNKADVNQQDHRGWTPLMIAAHKSLNEIVDILINEGGVDVAITDKFGKKAQDRAGNSEIFYMLSSAAIEKRMRDASSSKRQSKSKVTSRQNNRSSSKKITLRQVNDSYQNENNRLSDEVFKIEEGQQKPNQTRNRLTSQHKSQIFVSSTQDKPAQLDTIDHIKTLLYQVLKNHLSNMTDKINQTEQSLILQQIQKELASYENQIAEKIMKALQNMNLKLQKEITNFVNLKIRIAYLKSGINKVGSIDIEETFFNELEDLILLKLDDLENQVETEIQNSKVHSPRQEYVRQQNLTHVSNKKNNQSAKKKKKSSSKSMNQHGLTFISNVLQDDITMINNEQDVSQELKTMFLNSKDKQEIEKVKRELTNVLSQELEMVSQNLGERSESNVKEIATKQFKLLLSKIQSQLKQSVQDISANLQKRVETLVQERMTRLSAEVKQKISKNLQNGVIQPNQRFQYSKERVLQGLQEREEQCKQLLQQIGDFQKTELNSLVQQAKHKQGVKQMQAYKENEAPHSKQRLSIMDQKYHDAQKSGSTNTTHASVKKQTLQTDDRKSRFGSGQFDQNAINSYNDSIKAHVVNKTDSNGCNQQQNQSFDFAQLDQYDYLPSSRQEYRQGDQHILTLNNEIQDQQNLPPNSQHDSKLQKLKHKYQNRQKAESIHQEVSQNYQGPYNDPSFREGGIASSSSLMMFNRNHEQNQQGKLCCRPSPKKQRVEHKFQTPRTYEDYKASASQSKTFDKSQNKSPFNQDKTKRTAIQNHKQQSPKTKKHNTKLKRNSSSNSQYNIIVHPADRIEVQQNENYTLLTTVDKERSQLIEVQDKKRMMTDCEENKSLEMTCTKEAQSQLRVQENEKSLQKSQSTLSQYEREIEEIMRCNSNLSEENKELIELRNRIQRRIENSKKAQKS